MRRMARLFRNWGLAFLYPRPLIGVLYLPRFLRHWFLYTRRASAQKMVFADSQPCLDDWRTHTPFDAHYFYQGAWLARRIGLAQPAAHVDVGSSVLTVSVLSALVETIFVDYRPLRASLPGLTSVGGTILSLPFADDSIVSLSSLHVIEHIGLGRYGDAIDPEGSVKAARELQRVVRSGGKLFLSLPVGRERVCFNAHRVHAPASVLNMLSGMRLAEFSLVDDEGRYREAASLEDAARCEYGCGLFVFEKP